MIRQGQEREAVKAALCLTIIRARDEAEEHGMNEREALEHEAELILCAFERGVRATL